MGAAGLPAFQYRIVNDFRSAVRSLEPGKSFCAGFLCLLGELAFVRAVIECFAAHSVPLRSRRRIQYHVSRGCCFVRRAGATSVARGNGR
jgi:hypothetical protein